jgi:hypothetical protein
MFDEYDVVKLRYDRPKDRLSAGMEGTILMIHHASPAAYEVEFCDSAGYTLALLTLTDADLEPAE